MYGMSYGAILDSSQESPECTASEDAIIRGDIHLAAYLEFLGDIKKAPQYIGGSVPMKTVQRASTQSL